MEYSALFDFLVKQACGVYQIDPAEVNWSISGSGVSTNFESGSDRKQLLSQWRGLKPLLVHFSNVLNIKVIEKIDPRFRLEFEGLNRDREADLSIRKEEVKHYKTVNEVRDELGLSPLPWGDVILNPEFVKNMQGDSTDMGAAGTDWGMEDDTKNVDIEKEL